MCNLLRGFSYNKVVYKYSININAKIMKKRIIELIAGNYLSGDVENYYDAYLKLKSAPSGNFATNHVTVWEQVEDWTVEALLDAIEGQASQVEVLIKNILNETPIGKIDFPQLREQKKSLVVMIDHVDGGSELEGNLTGILHLIDSIQDYAVDVMGKNEEDVHLQSDE
jgi:hypothetical protein